MYKFFIQYETFFIKVNLIFWIYFKETQLLIYWQLKTKHIKTGSFYT